VSPVPTTFIISMGAAEVRLLDDEETLGQPLPGELRRHPVHALSFSNSLRFRGLRELWLMTATVEQESHAHHYP
jgi:hypothetical protein